MPVLAHILTHCLLPRWLGGWSQQAVTGGRLVSVLIGILTQDLLFVSHSEGVSLVVSFVTKWNTAYVLPHLHTMKTIISEA